MTKLKVLSVAAALALVLPIAMSSASFAQRGAKFGDRGGVRAGGGGGVAAGGGGGAVGVGGGFHRGPAAGGLRAGPVAGGAPVARFRGAPVVAGGDAGAKFAGAPRYVGGGPRYAGRNWNRGWRYRRYGGFWPGFGIGLGLGSSYAYYGDPYYDSYYYPPYGYGGGDATAYCMQRFKSYDPASGTYLGYDGKRHPCP